MTQISQQLYDSIGGGYEQLRRADPRIADALRCSLEGVASVVNIGAGAGSYEPTNVPLLAVEPSRTMIEQRAPSAARAIQACAESLPLRDKSFDAALAILTMHHWPDRARAFAELRRVATKRVVLLTWDPAAPGFWLTDYFPDILSIDKRIFPTLGELGDALGPLEVSTLPIPHDCTDGFLGAYWRRPEAYLAPHVRAAISTFAKLDDTAPGLQRLRQDLESGAWQAKHADLAKLTYLDLGYRIVTAAL